MEKSKMRPVKAGKSMRMSFSKEKEVLEMPNLIEIQKNSYEWFLGDGLREVFRDIFPIEDFAGHLSLDFVDFRLCRDDVKYSIEECKERDATYAAPIRVKVRLYKKDKANEEDTDSVKEEIFEHEIFMGDLPLMTDTGSFDKPETLTIAAIFNADATALRDDNSAFCNGTRLSGDSAANTWDDSEDDSIIQLGGRWGAKWADKGDANGVGYTIHAIRIYNRELSAGEIRRNAKQDAIRYFGATPEGMTVIIR